MDPGKARRVPVPMRFRRRLVTKAIPTAYQGPKKTPPSILMKCWIGAHLEAPTGMDKGEHTIPTATRMPARASLRTFTFYIFVRPFRYFLFYRTHCIIKLTKFEKI